MTIFTIEITDETHLAGITAARTAYNSAMQDAEIANPELISTDEEYIQFVMSRAAESYAKQYGV